MVLTPTAHEVPDRAQRLEYGTKAPRSNGGGFLDASVTKRHHHDRREAASQMPDDAGGHESQRLRGRAILEGILLGAVGECTSGMDSRAHRSFLLKQIKRTNFFRTPLPIDKVAASQVIDSCSTHGRDGFEGLDVAEGKGADAREASGSDRDVAGVLERAHEAGLAHPNRDPVAAAALALADLGVGMRVRESSQLGLGIRVLA
ncbi:hypothetical protein BDK51DRAFT_38348 [Blyttiomyces helicus]|uniref:Uncharacterized protein n=1 Tax=Blyttiomyces helicus TaxID=388810 RepID=A0A4P9W494_9FUNG|nr:hypothetical protein BDK51DRAFT_38348 [Blyttiomyces helicus]|eukprot:RKO87004.1 hypothetical protein BDK51DRAFT_38348 [Blyttiomyces helicus]